MTSSSTESSGADDARFHFISLEEAASRLNMSLRQFERKCAAGEGPKITRFSERKRAIRLDHFGEFLDAGVEASDAA